MEELRRKTVRLCYRCRTGRLRFPIVRATKLAAAAAAGEPLLPLVNPLGRGVVKQSKAFET